MDKDSRTIALLTAVIFFVVSTVGNFIFWKSEHAVFLVAHVSISPTFALIFGLFGFLVGFGVGKIAKRIVVKPMQKFAWLIICFASFGQSLGAVLVGFIFSETLCILMGWISLMISTGLVQEKMRENSDNPR